jgi:hypothetical protein
LSAGFIGTARAQSVGNTKDLLSIPGLASAAADAIKESKAVGFVDFHGAYGAGAMLPIRQLHDSSGVNYYAIGPGGLIKQDGHFRPRIIQLLDLSAIVRRLENKSDWYKAHVSKITLPDVWVGPQILIPFPGDNFQWKNARDYAGGAVSIGF